MKSYLSAVLRVQTEAFQAANVALGQMKAALPAPSTTEMGAAMGMAQSNRARQRLLERGVMQRHRICRATFTTTSPASCSATTCTAPAWRSQAPHSAARTACIRSRTHRRHPQHASLRHSLPMIAMATKRTAAQQCPTGSERLGQLYQQRQELPAPPFLSHSQNMRQADAIGTDRQSS